MKSKSILSQYVAFTRIYKKNRSIFGSSESTIMHTIDECIGSGILQDYFVKKRP